jgi:hypothetical protein
VIREDVEDRKVIITLRNGTETEGDSAKLHEKGYGLPLGRAMEERLPCWAL